MLIGYVADERYLAVPDVLLEFEGPGGPVEARSRATGSVHADLAPGTYRVTLSCPGFGSKRAQLSVPGDVPHLFRLLSDGLLGYAWPKWIRAGERSEFRVHSVVPYQLSLHRCGWNKQFVRSLGWYDEHGPRATMQITPDGDYTRTGVKWNEEGYTSPHHKQFVEAPARSGLYYFHARTAAGVEFGFPWIVAPGRPSAPIAVLASNLTWNAYNNFGGRSNYIHPDRLPPEPTVNARQDLDRYRDPNFIPYSSRRYAPLSFDRPEPVNHLVVDEQATDPIEGRTACHLAPAEWRLLAWLEREGYSYDYYAESQLHDGTLDLSAYKVLILSTHPEYWTRSMFDRVVSWVNREGGKLAYLGGNGINCQVELIDDGRAMVVLNGAKGLSPEGYESRFHLHGAPESTLLGVAWTEAGIMTAAPYQVIDGDHWIFARTGLRHGDLFGQNSLHMRCPGGASGHETDKRANGTPDGTLLLARGTNPDRGGAEMTYYETPAGGAVFAAGSITYQAALLVDPHISRITANVLDRFLGG